MKNSAPRMRQVLVVDDEKDSCFLLNNILKKKFRDVQLAGSITEAKNSLKTLHPACIFLDNHLPDGFGIEFISTLKELYPDVRIVMITAHDTDTDRRTALKNGADFFISKPFTTETINLTLEKIGNSFVE